MTTYALIAAAVVLIGFDPAKKLVAMRRAKIKKPVISYEEIRPEPPHEQTRMEAFKAAETLVLYFQSIGHTEAVESANNTAQWLFADPSPAEQKRK
jgi:hypothetical protein